MKTKNCVDRRNRTNLGPRKENEIEMIRMIEERENGGLGPVASA